jgi:uncharacterized protein (UPF0332 family)
LERELEAAPKQREELIAQLQVSIVYCSIFNAIECLLLTHTTSVKKFPALACVGGETKVFESGRRTRAFGTGAR